MARSMQAQSALLPKAEEDEAALIQAAQQSASRFTPLYRKYALPVYRYFYSRLGSPAEAEDLTSQVFLEALESLPRFRRGSSFPVWLFTIVRRRAIDHYRRKRLNVSIEAAKTIQIQPMDPCQPSSGRKNAAFWQRSLPGWKRRNASCYACDSQRS
jgi:DNA-directed RNA polymerase specialized sigma24 family protein